jgi:hypothetical protein
MIYFHIILFYIDSTCHAIYWWYVQCHITPHGLRVMALRSWRTLRCYLEAPKGQSNQSGLRDFKR